MKENKKVIEEVRGFVGGGELRNVLEKGGHEISADAISYIIRILCDRLKL